MEKALIYLEVAQAMGRTEIWTLSWKLKIALEIRKL